MQRRKRRLDARIGQRGLGLAGGEPLELGLELRAALADWLVKRLVVIDEEPPRLARPVLLALEQHRQLGGQQQHRGHRAQAGRRGDRGQPLAEPEVG